MAGGGEKEGERYRRIIMEGERKEEGNKHVQVKAEG